MEYKDKELFTKYAFLLWEHRERILSDSRMALCTLCVGNNLAYVNVKGIASATLGGYLLWWQEFERSKRTDKHNRRSLIYFIGGSPLSGRNHCGEVYESGKTKTITVAPFKDYWVSFAEAQGKLSATENNVQAYALAEVVAILQKEDSETIIDISKDELRRRHSEFNKLYFDNKLSMPTFYLLNKKRPFGQYRYCGEIWMSKPIKWTEPFLKEVLLHEMIHQYVHEVLHGMGFTLLIQHGLRFHYMRWRLKRKYGLIIT